MDKDRDDQNKNRTPEDKKPKGTIWITLIITAAVVLTLICGYNFIRNMQFTETTWDHFLEAKTAENLAEVNFNRSPPRR